jgi:hypothetical protein
MVKAFGTHFVLVDDGKCRAAYRAVNPLCLAEMFYKGGFAGAQGAMKGKDLSVAGMLPEGLGGLGNGIDCKLDFHAAKVAGHREFATW